jgi:hypothetical protein
MAAARRGCDKHSMSMPMRRLDESNHAERRLQTAVLVYGAGLAFACRALDEVAIGVALRFQARLSFALFVLSLSALWLHQLGGWSWAAWLERHRDALLRCFASSHLIHGVSLPRRSPTRTRYGDRRPSEATS